MAKAPNKDDPSLAMIAKAERFLNRVLAYQAAIAVHELQDELGLDVQELNLSVAPVGPDDVAAYRVVCTIVRASAPKPVVVELVVEPEKAVVKPANKSPR